MDVSTLVSENATVIQDISFLVFIVLLSLGILKVIGKLLIAVCMAKNLALAFNPYKPGVLFMGHRQTE